MKLHGVQIVNGLQTTRIINDYMQAGDRHSENRLVLIRVVVTEDEPTRDAIIKATNHQTAVTTAMLRATDPFQQSIETYFAARGWYSERRNNYYRNRGMPRDQIVGITYLAQAVLSLVMRKPDDARARPTSMIKGDADYNTVFDSRRNLDQYLAAAKIMRGVDTYLGSLTKGHRRQYASNFKFQIAMRLILERADETTQGNQLLTLAAVEQPNLDQILEPITNAVIEQAVAMETEKDWEADRVAKSADFTERLLEIE